MRAVITEIVSGFPPPASLNEIQSNSFAMNSTTGNCGAAALYAFGAIGIRPRAPNHSWRPAVRATEGISTHERALLRSSEEVRRVCVGQQERDGLPARPEPVPPAE